MKYKVIQWATGGIGRAAIQGIVDHPQLELVGCWVHSKDKIGRDAGAIAGIGDLGVTATGDIEEALSLEADCVIYSPVYPEERQVIRMLESGLSVVTPIAWFYPFGVVPIEAVQEACLKGKTTLHGTGIHPGGFTERFPLQLSAMQRATRYVRSEEWSDIRSYDSPMVVHDMMLFGKSKEEAEQSKMPGFLAAGFYQSIRMVADALCFALDDLKTVHKIGLATAPIDSPIGVIEPGRVAAQRFIWQGLRKGEPLVEAIVNWHMGEEGLEEGWRFGPGGQRYEVEVKGDPDLSAVYHGTHPKTIEQGLQRNAGIVATAMHCVNSVPHVCRAEPGVRTYLDLPLMAGYAAPELRA